jgi:hypothetical protein
MSLKDFNGSSYRSLQEEDDYFLSFCDFGYWEFCKFPLKLDAAKKNFIAPQEHNTMAKRLIWSGAKVVCSHDAWESQSILHVSVHDQVQAAAIAMFALKGRLFGGSIPCGKDICTLLAKLVFGRPSLSGRREWIEAVAERACVGEIKNAKRAKMN